MEQYWRRFETWLQANAPHLLSTLNNGATQSEIYKLEALVGTKLPEDFVQFYNIHNGQDGKKSREGLIDAEQLLSIDGIIIQWQCWTELLEDGIFDGINSAPGIGVKNDWWNPLWIPFTNDGMGDQICMDLDPSPAGSPGQVIQMRHDQEYRDIYARSFTEYISNYVDNLETGKYVYAEKWGVIEKRHPFNQP